MTTKISISHAVPSTTVQKVREFLDEEAARSPDWNGAVFQIERGDFTSMEEEGPRATILIREILNIIKEG